MTPVLLRRSVLCGLLAASVLSGARASEAAPTEIGLTEAGPTETVPAQTSLSETRPADFPEDSLRDWQRRDFVGRTDYELVNYGELRVLRGSTDGAATLLYREQSIDLTETPWIQWSWKVNTVYSGLDERSRAGDDFPARLYVVARTGILPWQTFALNYVWSSSGTDDALWLNPFSKQSAMIAVQSGASNVGQWTTQRRNIAQDFKRAFGKKIKKIHGFAVMVDGDNSGSSATAWFGNIDFLAR